MTQKSCKPEFAQLIGLVPKAPNWQIDWARIWLLWPEFAALDICPQDAIHHGEGDVGTHTRMVVEALVRDMDWRALSEDKRSLLFWATCLHDIGKPGKTRHEDDGRITSRGHSRLGALIARNLLWQAGAEFHWREALCGLILNHQLPFWLIERNNPARLAMLTSWQCDPLSLCIHAKADAAGRICEDKDALFENIDLARATFEEAGCLSNRFNFANDESRVAFVEREDRDPYHAAHESFRCHVKVMCALPGSGKDTWISQNCPDIPMLSLDVLRTQMKISPRANQGVIIQAAQEKARGYLRNRHDFVWNATNTTRLIRSKILRLLRDYGAFIEIIYLEVAPDKLLRQNSNREAIVPQSVIQNLARKLEPPEFLEAHKVRYVV